jgi:hypothetical protein
MNRQAATPKGLQKRVRDLDFGKVTDPRVDNKVKLSLPALLTALVSAMVTKARSLRMVEQRTAQIVCKLGSWMGLTRRIADNTFGKVLPRLKLAELMACLHRLVKAEHRRGNLKPTQLSVSAAAIDGKHVATLRWHDLCRVLKLDPTEATVPQVRKLLDKRFPLAQFSVPQDGQPYALMRVHTVTLISSKAAVCVHQRPIAGDTNENGSMPDLLEQLRATYSRCRLFELVTTDAGNTSCDNAAQTIACGWNYFAQIKSVHGGIHDEAIGQLSKRRKQRAHASYSDMQNGQLITYHVWCYDLTEQGWLDWTHARQIVRVQRTAEEPDTGKKTVGNRYYVTSLSTAELSAQDAMQISRGHWRCEDETHWTVDVELQEDRRRLSWSRHPDGVLVVSALRMMALAILAVARRLSRVGYSKETPSWAQVAEHFMLQLCDSILETEAFDAV